MGFQDLRKRLTSTVEQIEDQRLQERFRGLGLSDLDHVVLRKPARVGGKIQRMRITPRSGASALEIIVSDGTGTVTAVFTGRRRIQGLETGRSVVLEGVPYAERGHRTLLNPAYTLLPG